MSMKGYLKMPEERRAQLEKNISDAYELVSEIENQLLLSGEAQERLRLKKQIAEARKQIAAWEAELDGIKPAKAADTKKRPCPMPPSEAAHPFAGREKELTDLQARLMAGKAGAIIAVYGLGGIGKTSLARRLANKLFYDERAFRSVVWAEVGQNPQPINKLLEWAYLCDPAFTSSGQGEKVLAQQIKGLLEALIEEGCAECEGGRSLIVLDDIWGEDSIATAKLLLEAAPAGSVVLLTTRSQSIAVRLGAQPSSLPGLTPEEGVALLQLYLPQADPALLKDLSLQLGGHPLALTLAAKRVQLTTNPAKALATHLNQYKGGLPQGSAIKTLQLEAGTTRDENFELVLSYSYDELKPADQARFRALGALAYNQPFDLMLLAALWGETADATAHPTEDALSLAEADCDTLRHRSLLEPTTLPTDPLIPHPSSLIPPDDWFRQHPLLQSYARSLLLTAPAVEQAATRRRYETCLIELAEKFDKLQPEDWGELTPYLPHIHAVGAGLVEQSATSEADEDLLRRALDFARNTKNYLFRRREVRQLDWLQMGLDVSRRLQDQKRESLFLNELGLAYSALGEEHKALEHYEQALQLKRAVGDRGGEATTLNNIGSVYDALGEKSKALEYYEQALPLRRAVGDRGGEARTLNNIGGVYSALGEQSKALEYYEQALPIQRAVGDRGGEATTLNNIGGVYSALGEKSKALEYYEQALPIQRAVGDRGGEARTLNNIGGVYDALGEKSKALEYYEQALPLRRAVGDRGGEAVTSYNIGWIYYGRGQLEEAISWVARCVELDEQVQHPDLESDRALLTKWQAELKAQQGGAGGAG